MKSDLFIHLCVSWSSSAQCVMFRLSRTVVPLVQMSWGLEKYVWACACVSERDAACVLDWEAACSGVICVQALTATFTSLVTLGKLLGLSMHQFLHLKNMDDNNNDNLLSKVAVNVKRAETCLQGTHNSVWHIVSTLCGGLMNQLKPLILLKPHEYIY